MNIAIPYSVLTILLIVTSPNVLATSKAEWCDKQWETISSQKLVDPRKGNNGLLAAWQQLEEKCKGTGIYEPA